MRSQPTLRPFDLAVALRLVRVPGERYEPLAAALSTSTSAVHRAVARLQLAGICARGSRTVQLPILRDFIIHGAPVAFPASTAQPRVGVPTAWTLPELSALAPPNAAPFVWPAEHGSAHGTALVPLFQAASRAAERDPQLHRLLALVDAVRLIDPPARVAARDLVEARLRDAADGG